MSATTRVAVRYAKALIEEAVKEGRLDAVKTDMELIDNTCQGSRPLRVVLSNPIIVNEKKQEILHRIFGEQIQPLTARFITLLTGKNRAGELAAVASTYIDLYNERMKVQTATVTTTFPLSENLRVRFTDKVRKLSGRQDIQLEEIIDPSILGGYILAIGNDKIDASVKRQFQEIRLAFQN